jgi:zinc and cadmium transporter
MENLFLWILVFTTLGGVLGVFAAAVFLVLPTRLREGLLPSLVSFAIGTLLGAAFLALLPHALEAPGQNETHTLMFTVLAGVLAFFLLEKIMVWRHCHTDACEAHGVPVDERAGRQAAAGNLVLIGDGIHNLVDGVLIGAAFLTDIHLGVVTSIAVIAHEIPQEVGDFAILLASGYSRAQAFVYNVAASLTTILGGIAAYYSLPLALGIVPYVLALAAASFIYIAVADLIPGLHRRPELRVTLQQLALIGLGVAVIYLSHEAAH